MSAMNFNLKDLYPNMMGHETSTSVAPESDDQNVLNEDYEKAQKVSQTQASNKTIFISIIVIVALVVFLGGAK